MGGGTQMQQYSMGRSTVPKSWEVRTHQYHVFSKAGLLPHKTLPFVTTYHFLLIVTHMSRRYTTCYFSSDLFCTHHDMHRWHVHGPHLPLHQRSLNVLLRAHLTSMTQLKMWIISCSHPPPLLPSILSTFQAQRSLIERSSYGKLAPCSLPRTRILSTSGVAVVCIFSLGRVSWRGVYLQFLQLQQLPSACFPRLVTCWVRTVHVSRVTTWRC